MIFYNLSNKFWRDNSRYHKIQKDLKEKKLKNYHNNIDMAGFNFKSMNSIKYELINHWIELFLSLLCAFHIQMDRVSSFLL